MLLTSHSFAFKFPPYCSLMCRWAGHNEPGDQLLVSVTSCFLHFFSDGAGLVVLAREVGLGWVGRGELWLRDGVCVWFVLYRSGRRMR